MLMSSMRSIATAIAVEIHRTRAITTDPARARTRPLHHLVSATGRLLLLLFEDDATTAVTGTAAAAAASSSIVVGKLSRRMIGGHPNVVVEVLVFALEASFPSEQEEQEHGNDDGGDTTRDSTSDCAGGERSATQHGIEHCRRRTSTCVV